MQLGVILMTAVNAVFPILALIALGYVLKQKGFFTEEFLKYGNKLVFHVCIPVMLFVNVYQIPSLSDISWDLIGYVVGMILLLVLLGAVVGSVTTKDSARKGVLMQVVFRSNYAIIGLPLAELLGGTEAVAIAAVISAFAVPMYNIFAVVALTVFRRESGARISIRKLLLDILKNPLILGVLAGLAALGLRQAQVGCLGQLVFSLERDLPFLYKTLQNVKGVTTPLALIVLGGQFAFGAVKGMFREILVGTVWRLLMAPLLGIGVAAALNVAFPALGWGAAEYPALLALFGTPVAVSSAVMAGAMGNDRQLATQLVVWTSLGSMATLFVSVCVLMAAGLLGG